MTTSLFGQSTFGQTTNFGGMSSNNPNPMKDVEVANPPDDSISCLRFSPGSVQSTLLLAGSWDNNVRCWEIQPNGTSLPKAQQSMQASSQVAFSSIEEVILLGIFPFDFFRELTAL